MWARFKNGFRKEHLYWVPPAIFVNTQVVTITNVRGRSMQPTFNPDSNQLFSDVVLLDRASTSPWITWYGQYFGIWRPKFERGDVIVLRSPDDPTKRIIKRIVATEYEVVKTLPPHPDPVVQVPQGHVWVEGDEPFHSKDSNYFGPASLGLVEGKIKGIVWPPSRIGPVPSPPPARTAKRVFKGWPGMSERIGKQAGGSPGVIVYGDSLDKNP
ncbi:hypothetical protein M407DRAFT_83014 [Tulasnella calospora MUT 4182]|uniref:Mitochondrial inner membrane protease subunit 2 n=1 Tax=Tulasnella calospora MUT 4182 TaxID=1051891 RepID=A0A0C3Q675_9AGAM|nr:hypothetical protein M407DRAFT_83014 [Tulasnella calospora MUT 4182]